MKFWLIVFVFTSQGEFMWKDIYPVEQGYERCVEMAGEVSKKYVNLPNSINMFCVSDDHYTGKNYDEGIPLDFHDYQQTLNPMDRHE